MLTEDQIDTILDSRDFTVEERDRIVAACVKDVQELHRKKIIFDPSTGAVWDGKGWAPQDCGACAIGAHVINSQPSFNEALKKVRIEDFMGANGVAEDVLATALDLILPTHAVEVVYMAIAELENKKPEHFRDAIETDPKGIAQHLRIREGDYQHYPLAIEAAVKIYLDIWDLGLWRLEDQREKLRDHTPQEEHNG